MLHLPKYTIIRASMMKKGNKMNHFNMKRIPVCFAVYCHCLDPQLSCRSNHSASNLSPTIRLRVNQTFLEKEITCLQ